MHILASVTRTYGVQDVRQKAEERKIDAKLRAVCVQKTTNPLNREIIIEREVKNG